MSLVAHLFGRVEYQVHCLPCCFNTILSLFRDTESMFEVMAVSIENLLCSSATGPQSRYNRESLILISNMGFQFWTIWTAQGSREKKYKLLLSCFHVSMGKIGYPAQYVAADLNKKSCSGPKITTAWKSILYRSKITLYWNLRKSGMYYEFWKHDILLMQQLKVLVAISIKTVLWNAWFSRILIHGYFEPIWDTLSCCVSL